VSFERESKSNYPPYDPPSIMPTPFIKSEYITSICVAKYDPPENPDIVTEKLSAPKEGNSLSLLIQISEY